MPTWARTPATRSPTLTPYTTWPPSCGPGAGCAYGSAALLHREDDRDGRAADRQAGQSGGTSPCPVLRSRDPITDLGHTAGHCRLLCRQPAGADPARGGRRAAALECSPVDRLVFLRSDVRARPAASGGFTERRAGR